MRNNLTPLRPGLTAIAAVLALSATPVFAQSAETVTAPAQEAPVISAPPAAAETAPAAPAAAAPLQSSVTSENSAAPVETAAPMATQSSPVIHTADTSTPAVAPVTKAAAPKPAAVAAPRAVVAAAPAPAPTAAPRVTPAVAPSPPVAVTAPAPVVKSSTTTSIASDDSRELELAGIGAVGLLALIGGAVALSRRKRDDEDELVLAPTAITTTPMAAEPVAYETPAASPVTAVPMAIEGAPATALHEDFDISRYGAHVQTAYRGPTEDNPSLSLRHRLKRARFMDQRARETGDYAMTPEMAPIAAERRPIAQNLIGARLKQGLQSLRPQSGGLRPAFS